MKPSLCLNMIVKNEAARIERCLASVLPVVKAVCILDTGSTDDTPAKIVEMCRRHMVPVHVGHGEFKNFSQARNDAFALAQRRIGRDLPHCQFVLLMDADMQLRVANDFAFTHLDAREAAYDMIQKSGTMSYANRRILNVNWHREPYVGVTHEYIDVPGSGMIEGAYFNDFADGANREGKFKRDAELLEEGLKSEPENARYWYYLGNTYRDDKQYLKALRAYEKRIDLGGWDEETHSAMMNIADIHRMLGDNPSFITSMLDAYNFRPRRAEPLYELARFYRERGENAAATLFAKRGLAIPKPNDLLFLNDFAYSHGLRYEYSIAGYYVDEERQGAFQATNALALDPTCDPSIRENARQNLYWHLKHLKEFAPSFIARRVEADLPAGYVGMNPSVVVHDGAISCNVRCVNYTINEHGSYIINGTQDPAQPHAPIDTQNIVVSLDHSLNKTFQLPIVWERPAPAFPLVTGLEDVRLWFKDGRPHFNACVRELHAHGTPIQVQGELDYDDGVLLVTDLKHLSDGSQCEKNWMHMQGDTFVYWPGTTVTDGVLENCEDNPIYPMQLRGGSQCIPFNDGWLCVVHEACEPAGNYGKRMYWHRFLWLNKHGRPSRISRPFVFFDRQIEFCAGLAHHPNKHTLLLSFGVRDAEAWIAEINSEEVSAMLETFYEN